MKTVWSAIRMRGWGCALAMMLLCPGSIHASVSVPSELLYGFTNVYSGTDPASSSLPWVTLLFQDVTVGTVNVTIANTALTGTEFLTEFDFNLNTNLNPANLVFTYQTGSGGFALPSIGQVANNYKADGDGYYDISFGFAVADGGANRFTAGEYVTYQITGIGLTAADFNCLSLPAGGSGPFYAATHVQGIGSGGTDSGWISVTQVTTVPEPGTSSIAAMGSLFLTGLIVKRRNKKNL